MKFDAKALKSIREQRGLTQDELAVRLHVSAATISQWEGGVTAPRPSRIGTLAETLRCRIEDLADYGETAPARATDAELEELLAVWHSLSAEQRSLLVSIVRTWRKPKE